jgi:hypothetical protein
MLNKLFSQQRGISPEAFWEWFQANETKIWDIDQNTEKVKRILRNALDQVCPDLVFEIGMSVVDGKRQLFISDGGNPSKSPVVENLYLAAPAMDHWRIIKDISTGSSPVGTGMDTAAASIINARFQLFNDGDRIGILLMFENYRESERSDFARIGPVLLNKTLGEQDVANRVGFVDYAGPESNFYPDARPLSELRKAVDNYFHIYR